jgi:1,6-anhydro-N-acetylmuramate kinase
VSFLGSFLPFARNAAEREKTGDPRPSVAERYVSREQYMGKFAEAAKVLIQERFLLQEDLPAVLERGQREWDEVAGEK